MFIRMFFCYYHYLSSAERKDRSKWIVEHCLSGDLIKGRTVILVVRPPDNLIGVSYIDPALDTQCRSNQRFCRFHSFNW
jgi:hypothetical protein